jgi:[acyl-carrier-protein] S-malonyltransferase
MADALGQAHVNAPVVPLYANVTAAPVADPDLIRSQLVDQVTGRVRWRESVAAMEAAGAVHFVECGGKVLGPMVKRSAAGEVETTSVITMDDIEAVLRAL